MDRKILHLIPDTNLFIQCRPLHELNWKELGEFDEIRLIACRTVIREIDDQKQKGNDRVGRRSREWNTKFRDMVKSGSRQHIVIRGKPRTVKLLINYDLLPSNDLEETLDYSIADDQIVGCVPAFKEKHKETDVRLLTDDTTTKGFKENWIVSGRPNRKSGLIALTKMRMRSTSLSMRGSGTKS